ncbi:hypothetical protein [Glutamicibacter arilaitensis]|uniref:hypothetical protein n=1 Tax=Glutamicibacter arilaitensis TaxID=256701 RepID=UPI00384DE79B
MNLAEKYSCDIPMEGTTFVECTLPGAGALEWLTAFGTVGAVVAAIWISLASKNNRDRERWENIADDFIEVLNQISLEYPNVPEETEAKFRSKFARLASISDRRSIGISSAVLTAFKVSVSRVLRNYNNTNSELAASMLDDEFYSRRKSDAEALLSEKIAEWVNYFSALVYSKNQRRKKLKSMEAIAKQLDERLTAIAHKSDYKWGE